MFQGLPSVAASTKAIDWQSIPALAPFTASTKAAPVGVVGVPRASRMYSIVRSMPAPPGLSTVPELESVVAAGTTVQPTPKFGTVNALLGGIDHAAVDPTTSSVFVVYGGDNGTSMESWVDGNAIFIVQVTFDNSTPTMAIIGTPHQVSVPPWRCRFRHCRQWRSRPMVQSAFSTPHSTASM